MSAPDDRKPKWRKANVTRFRKNLTEEVNHTHYTDEPVIITNNGKPRAVMISIREAKRLDIYNV